MSNLEKAQPHAVLLPYPAQGHVNPMMKLAKLLYHNGFHITFVNTEYNHRRLLQSRGPDALNGLPSFKFKTIPDGLPPSDATNITQSIPALCESTSAHSLAPFKKLIIGLNESNGPPVSCIITDGLMNFTIDAAEELGIPQVMFQTTSACGLLAYAKYESIVQKGYVPLKDKSYLSNGYLDTVIEGVPGLIRGMRLRDIPSYIRTTNANDFMLNFLIGEVEKATRASAIILNTFEPLEQDSLDVLSAILPPIHIIGPLHLLETHLQDNPELAQLGSNLWKNDPKCLQWLDTKDPDSVLFVNFGSITVMTPSHLTEFAWGLANSNQPFLWIIRPDLVSGEKAILPPEFLEAIKERGMIASWCSQEDVLNHKSVGGFLTHSGWNSTLESICSGVPMICWPFFVEQMTNCWYSSTQWGIGMEIDKDVRRDDVASLVRMLMVGERGKEMKRKALEWKKLAHESANTSYYLNLQKFITQIC